jgi:hypothetical protein
MRIFLTILSSLIAFGEINEEEDARIDLPQEGFGSAIAIVAFLRRKANKSEA